MNRLISENTRPDYPMQAAVTRLTPTHPQLEASTAHFKQRIVAERDREGESLKPYAEQLVNVGAAMRSRISSDPRMLASMNALHGFAREEGRRRLKEFPHQGLRDGSRTLSFTANPGFQIIAPPYDLSLMDGLLFANKDSGKILAFSEGHSVTGAVGVFLSSSDRALVRVSPFAQITYHWSGFERGAPVFTRGEVGVVVYADGDPQPAFDYRGSLWRTWLGGKVSGSGSTTLASALSRDVLITMEPRRSYLVWVWCSPFGQATLVEGHEGWAAAQIACEVPFIVVDSSPASNIR